MVFEVGGLNEVIGTDDIDRLVGTAGADRIDALGGALDTITGGGGNDVFDFTSSSDNEMRERKIITDFTPGEDLIDLGVATVLSTQTFGTYTFVNLSDDIDQIVLLNVPYWCDEFLL